MKPEILKRIAFIGKSMLWSLGLYAIFMLAINWNDIKHTVAGNNVMVIANTEQPQDIFNNPTTIIPANISQHANIFKGIISLIKTVSGISAAMSK